MGIFIYLYCCVVEQNLPNSGDDQFKKFPDMVELNAANVLPQDTLPSYPLCPDAGNNMNASPNCDLQYGISNGSRLMSQNYQREYLSSDFPVNGNISQQPMLDDGPLLPSLTNQIDGPYKS